MVIVVYMAGAVQRYCDGDRHRDRGKSHCKISWVGQLSHRSEMQKMFNISSSMGGIGIMGRDHRTVYASPTSYPRQHIEHIYFSVKSRQALHRSKKVPGPAWLRGLCYLVPSTIDVGSRQTLQNTGQTSLLICRSDVRPLL